jgi:hypothetical protein
MLDVLLSNNILTSWSIYDNDSKGVCVNIRFRHVDNAMLVQPCTYRKQSANQATRNRNRALLHQNNKDSNTSPDIGVSKKRKMEHLTPEQNREYNMDIPHNDANIDTPELVTMENNENLDTSLLVLEYEHKDMDNLKSVVHLSPGPQSTKLQQSLADHGLVEYDFKKTSDPELVEYDYERTDSQQQLNSGTQVSPRPHTTEPLPTKSDINITTDEILCPCCNIKMTTTHVCDTLSDSADDQIELDGATPIVSSLVHVPPISEHKTFDNPPDPPDTITITDSEARALLDSIRESLTRPIRRTKDDFNT